MSAKPLLDFHHFTSRIKVAGRTALTPLLSRPAEKGGKRGNEHISPRRASSEQAKSAAILGALLRARGGAQLGNKKSRPSVGRPECRFNPSLRWHDPGQVQRVGVGSLCCGRPLSPALPDSPGKVSYVETCYITGNPRFPTGWERRQIQSLQSYPQTSS